MMIRISELTKSFFSLRGDVAVLRGLTLDIRDGEFFVLLGPSGCGKSTLLNLIAGLEAPTSGRILFGDAVMADGGLKVCLPPRRRNVAMVFQSYALYPHLSVFDNIAFPLSIEGRARGEIAAAVRDAAAMLELEGLLKARPAELSGGQRQRVAIARALVRKPSVFLLDEPLSNLDAQLRSSMRRELKALQRRLGITTVYVTHDQVEAMSLGDRVALLHNGALAQVGSPGELYARPANAFVGAFIGSPAMNLLEARRVEEGGLVLVELRGVRCGLTREAVERLRKLGGRPFLLGVRPEHVVLDPRSQESLRWKAVVRSVERLGRESLLDLDSGGFELTALVPAGAFEEGQEVGWDLDWERVHFLEAPEGGVPSDEEA